MIVYHVKKFISFFYYICRRSTFSKMNFEIHNNACLILGGGPSSTLLEDYLHDYDTIFCVGLSIEKLVYLRDYLIGKKIYVIVAPFHKPQTIEMWEEWLTRVQTASSKIGGVHLVYYSGFSTRYMWKILSKIDNKTFDATHFGFCNPGKTYSDFIFRLMRSKNDLFLRFHSSGSILALGTALKWGYSEVGLLGVDHTLALDLNEMDQARFRSSVHAAEFNTNISVRYIEELRNLANVNEEFIDLSSQYTADISQLNDESLVKVF